MGTVVESQILKENEKCHILHFKTDKEWHRRSALLETVLNNRETQMKTMPGASSVLPISISILSGPSIPSVSHFILFLNPHFFFFGHHPASGLAPDLLSSFFCVSALHQLQGHHRALCSSWTTAPLPAVDILSSAGDIPLPNPGVAGSFLSFRF